MSESQILEWLRQFPWEPAWLLALVIALIYGTIFHILWGRRRHTILFYWLVAIVSVLLAQWLFSRAPVAEWSLGNLHIIEASLLCWVVLFIANAIKI